MDLNIPAGVPDLNQAIAEEKEDGPDDVHDGGHDRVVHPLDLNFVAAEEEEEFIPGKILIACTSTTPKLHMVFVNVVSYPYTE